MNWSGLLALVISYIGMLTDLKWQKIPNLLIIAGWEAGLLYAFLIQEIHIRGIIPEGIAIEEIGSLPKWLLGVSVPMLVLGIFYYFHMLGAGDIKLLSALGGLMGPDAIIYCIFWSAIFGSGFAIMEFVLYQNARERFQYFFQYVQEYVTTKKRVPYCKPGRRPENLHFAVPVFMSVLLWIGGVY